MTEKASLFYLSEPSKGVPVVLLQVGEKVMVAEITLNQLALLIADGAAMAFRMREPAE